MECDLGRLHIAVSAAVKRIDQERKFQMDIHGAKSKADYVPPRNQTEQVERARATFASLGTVKVAG